MDLRAASRLLQLVICIEEKDYDYADYQLRAVRTWLRRHSIESPFSRAFLRLMGQIIEGSGTSYIDQIRQQKETMSALPPIQGSNEIMIWMESKVRGISLQEVCEQLIPEMR